MWFKSGLERDSQKLAAGRLKTQLGPQAWKEEGCGREENRTGPRAVAGLAAGGYWQWGTATAAVLTCGLQRGHMPAAARVLMGAAWDIEFLGTRCSYFISVPLKLPGMI